MVGIVASRLSEEFCRPTFLICLSGDRGKASSRSYGGFNLFAALTELSYLLEGYGGHELAAGFTISRENIDEFRREICRKVEEFNASGQARSALEADCEPEASLMTLENVDGLSQLEPCGTCCPRPIFVLSEMRVESVGTVGSGKHLRLTLQSRDGIDFQTICFSGGNLAKRLAEGDRVDIAFHAQINEYRGIRSVQLSLLDLRKVQPEQLYNDFKEGKQLSAYERRLLAPERADIGQLWHYLDATAPLSGWLSGDLDRLYLGVSQLYPGHSLRRTHACLDILRELGLIELEMSNRRFRLQVFRDIRNPLENSRLYRSLRGD